MPRTQSDTPPESPPPLLTTKDLADHLRLNERTVLKLASQGELPGVRIGNQWRFKQSVIDTWLEDQMLGLRPSSIEYPSDLLSTFTLDDCFAPEHVILALQGSTMPAVLEELCKHAFDLGLVRDKTWFLGALLERENLLASAVGSGIAFPHTTHRHPEQVVRPFLIMGRAPQGIDFGAPDGEPVRLIMLMGLRFQELHLPWLAKLSKLLRTKEVRQMLLGAQCQATVTEVLRSHLHYK